MNGTQTLTSFERAVMEKMLAGYHPLFGALREQLEQPADFTIGDVTADIRGLKHGAGFVLSVEEGL